MLGIESRVLVIGLGVLSFIGFGLLNARQTSSISEQVASDYTRTITVLDRVIKRTSRARIILAGGSNVVFGEEAHLISERIDRPVVNLGVLSLMDGHQNYFDWLVTVVRPGDTVLYSDAYWMVGVDDLSQFNNNERRTAKLLSARLKVSFSRASEASWPFWKMLPDRAWAATMTSAASSPRFVPALLEPWRRDAWGDIRGCVPVDSRHLKAEESPRSSRTDDAVQQAGKLAARLREIGVRTFFIMPTTLVAPRDLTAWRAHAKAVESKLGLAGRVIHLPAEEVLKTEPSLFCDDAMHLASEAKHQRSIDIASRLKRIL